MRGLVTLLRDKEERVCISAMAALRMLSESRDGCEILLGAESVQILVGCLTDMRRSQPLTGDILFSVGNLLRLEPAIAICVQAGLVGFLLTSVQNSESPGYQTQALILKCIQHLAGSDAGKLALINANGMSLI